MLGEASTAGSHRATDWLPVPAGHGHLDVGDLACERANRVKAAFLGFYTSYDVQMQL